MKKAIYYIQNSNTPFTTIPVVRLDSGAIGIPVEPEIDMAYSRVGKHVYRIREAKGMDVSWR